MRQLKIYLFGSKDIKDLFLRALDGFDWRGKRVVDFPAGSGFTSAALRERGAEIIAWDIFPEFFKVDGLKCALADLQSTFPAHDGEFDVAIFQEGIEHLQNQLLALQEFNRILKLDGRLFLTTPNYSNLRSRFSYFCFEAENPKMMPPNEIESVWFGKDSRIYYGHIFPTGIMRLRVLARLAGFEIAQIHPARVNITSLLFGLVLYPFIWGHAWRCYFRAVRKNAAKNDAAKKKVFREQVALGTHPSILLGGHLIVEFKKGPTFLSPVYQSIGMN